MHPKFATLDTLSFHQSGLVFRVENNRERTKNLNCLSIRREMTTGLHTKKWQFSAKPSITTRAQYRVSLPRLGRFLSMGVSSGRWEPVVAIVLEATGIIPTSLRSMGDVGFRPDTEELSALAHQLRTPSKLPGQTPSQRSKRARPAVGI